MRGCFTDCVCGHTNFGGGEFLRMFCELRNTGCDRLCRARRSRCLSLSSVAGASRTCHRRSSGSAPLWCSIVVDSSRRTTRSSAVTRPRSTRYLYILRTSCGVYQSVVLISSPQSATRRATRDARPFGFASAQTRQVGIRTAAPSSSSMRLHFARLAPCSHEPEACGRRDAARTDDATEPAAAFRGVLPFF